MLSDPQRDYIRNVTRTLQIIVGALAGGVLTFLAVVIYLVSQSPPIASPDVPVVTYCAYAMAVVCGVASFVVPSIVASRAHASLASGDVAQWGLVKNLPNVHELGEVAPLAAIYQTRTIVGAALCEGAAFFACVAYQLERQRPALVVALVLFLLIARHFPTVSRLESAIDNDLTMVQQLRELR